MISYNPGFPEMAITFSNFIWYFLFTILVICNSYRRLFSQFTRLSYTRFIFSIFLVLEISFYS
jgi:hypothetical protein